MKIGCPKEIKPQEFRVGMTPNAAREAVGPRGKAEQLRHRCRAARLRIDSARRAAGQLVVEQ